MSCHVILIHSTPYHVTSCFLVLLFLTKIIISFTTVTVKSRIGYTGLQRARVSRNLISAFQHPSNLGKEVSLGRVAGPFSSFPLSNFQCHPVGVVPKKHSLEQRTIYHLSFLEGDSINDHIPKDRYSLQCVHIDDAIHILQCLGKGAFIVKTDL